MVKICASTAGGTGLIPSWGIKILYAAQHNQKKFKKEPRIQGGPQLALELQTHMRHICPAVIRLNTFVVKLLNCVPVLGTHGL